MSDRRVIDRAIARPARPGVLQSACAGAIGIGLLAGAGTLEIRTVAAQEAGFPSRPVRIVVPYPPGGPNDILARMLGARLGEGWNQPVVIDNRPGAGGNIGTVTVTRANPDGHTVVLHAMAVAVNPTLYGDAVPYKLSELAPVTLVARGPLVMTVHPSVPANSVKEFLALARARPGSINYGSGGNGSSLHLAGELFKAQSGAAITHIPYKGSADMINDLLGGRISVVFASPLNAVPLARQGKLRMLAVTSARRASALPELPTLAEGGVPGYDMEAWFAVLAPVATPRTVVAQLSKQIGAALRSPEVQERLAALGIEAAPTTPEQAAEYIQREAARWDRILRTAGVKAD